MEKGKVSVEKGKVSIEKGKVDAKRIFLKPMEKGEVYPKKNILK